jgi:hypothetical protein
MHSVAILSVLSLATFQSLVSAAAIAKRDIHFSVNYYSDPNGGCGFDSYLGTATTSALFGGNGNFDGFTGPLHVGAILVTQLDGDSPNIVDADGQTVFDGCFNAIWPDPSGCIKVDRDVSTLSFGWDGCQGIPAINTRDVKVDVEGAEA